MYTSILVPIDLADPERGKSAIELAMNIAADGAKIRLVSVIEDIPAFVAVELSDSVSGKIRDNAEAQLRGLAVAAGLKPGDAEVRTGTAASGILTAAESMEADLIVVGSHKPALQDYLLGSTAGRIVRHATCAVLVTR